VCSKEAHIDQVRGELEGQQRRLEAETEGYTKRKEVFEQKEIELDLVYEKKNKDLDMETNARKKEMDTEYAVFKKAKEHFDMELKVGLQAISQVKHADSNPHSKHVKFSIIW